jgi:hypothetical protein
MPGQYGGTSSLAKLSTDDSPSTYPSEMHTRVPALVPSACVRLAEGSPTRTTT